MDQVVLNCVMHSAIRIRPAGKADLPAILGLYRCLAPEDPNLDANKAQEIWSQMLNSGAVIPLVAVADCEPVASCILVIVPNLTRGGRAFAVIENVITHPRFRRRGIGTAMLHDAVKRAWAANCYKVVLTTRRRSEELYAFYEKAGFQRATRTAFDIRSP